MSEPLNVESILSQIGKQEKEYDWLGAVESYRKALVLVPERDFLKLGEIHEKIGNCFHRASFQAESRENFRERVRLAVEAYEKASEFYEKLSGEQRARSFRSEAAAKYHCFWLTSNPSERNKFLDECLELAGKALKIFSESSDMQEYARTYNALAPFEYTVFILRFAHEWDRKVIEEFARKGVRWGEKAVSALEEIGDPRSSAVYIVMATCLLTLTWFAIADPEAQEQHREKALRYINKALDFSEKAGDAALLALSHFWLAESFTEGDESIRCLKRALECTEKTQDNWFRATGLSWLAIETYWKAIETEDPDQRLKLSEEAMRYYDKSEHLFSIFSFICPRGGLISPPGGYTEHYFYLAEWETDPEKKLEFLRESEKIGLEALKVAENSEVPVAIIFMLYMLGKTLTARARLEPDINEKKSLLEKALRYLERSIGIYTQWKPFVYWNIGAFYNRLADTKAEMGYLESDLKTKRMLLEEAASYKEKCLELIAKRIPSYEKRGKVVPYTSIYGYQDTYWTLLNHLYKLTNNTEHLRKAIEITQKAMESAIKLDIATLMAESYWKIAKAQDILQEYLPAAENFEHASTNYSKAAEKIPKLKDLYQNYASYMQAWSEIEKAKHHHKRQESGLAKEHFEKAASIQKSLKQWSYLAPNYSALAQIENAEDLSRKEQSEEALKAFEQAAKLFDESKESLQAELTKIEGPEEKQMVTSMVKAAALRSEYCNGRIVLEEAKILDKKGDHYSSSEKYGSAAGVFEKVTQALESEQDRKELQLILTLSKAWQKMTRAEAEASPTLYMEASQLFEQAKGISPSEKAKMLALGHSRFCRALEAGTKFADTRDPTLHATAIHHLESATNYYVKAGFQNASEYAKATELLFDAYVHMDNAKKESDPEKRAKLYAMAEKVLQTSAGSFMKAEHPEKREQVLRLLDNVKEERELALSLSEVLHAPSIISTTTVFTTPTPNQENAVGLERFENADIQVNIIIHQKELNVGENLDLEIELVNAGKGPAILTKIAEVIPDGFDLAEKPEIYRVEDSYINMKGKRLDPLKTEEVRLVLKPRVQGVFHIKPRILYLDENGKYKSHEPEPINITVKELGIKGWIKGKR